MGDRDHLAADLRRCRIAAVSPDDGWPTGMTNYAATADRLIALGWTRLDGDSIHKLLVDLDPPLDEERLAAQMQRRYGWSPTKAWQEAVIIGEMYRENSDG